MKFHVKLCELLFTNVRKCVIIVKEKIGSQVYNSMKEKSKGLMLKVFCILEMLIIIAMSLFMAWYIFIRSEPQQPEKVLPVMSPESPSETSEETVTDNTEVSEEPVIRKKTVIEKEETLYQLEGKKILFDDGTYGEIFMPVFSEVPASTLSESNFVTRNGYSFYRENNTVTSYTGVDVSEYQGDIDWYKVKQSGIDFAIIRIGYRTYGSGKIEIDKKFQENLENASSAGLETGVYFFSQATDVEEATEEANIVLDAIEPYNITYPVIFDWEIISGDSARTDKVSVETLADCCVSFCETVKSAGYKPMIYMNKNTTLRKLDLPRVKDYDFWLAEYDEKPSYYYDFKMWQYASDGEVAGIDGEVDMNICFSDYSQY